MKKPAKNPKEGMSLCSRACLLFTACLVTFIFSASLANAADEPAEILGQQISTNITTIDKPLIVEKPFIKINGLTANDKMMPNVGNRYWLVKDGKNTDYSIDFSDGSATNLTPANYPLKFDKLSEDEDLAKGLAEYYRSRSFSDDKIKGIITGQEPFAYIQVSDKELNLVDTEDKPLSFSDKYPVGTYNILSDIKDIKPLRWELNIVSESTSLIASFNISNQTDATVINETTGLIKLTMPFTADLKNLTPNIVFIGGKVSLLPIIGKGDHDFSVVRKYQVTSVDGTFQKTYLVKVYITVDPDIALVAADYDWLRIDGHFPNLMNVTNDVELLLNGPSGSDITWQSNHPEIVSNEGIVHRPSFEEGDKVVDLTATITKGRVSKTKLFALNVIKNNPLPPITERIFIELNGFTVNDKMMPNIGNRYWLEENNSTEDYLVNFADGYKANLRAVKYPLKFNKLSDKQIDSLVEYYKNSSLYGDEAKEVALGEEPFAYIETDGTKLNLVDTTGKPFSISRKYAIGAYNIVAEIKGIKPLEWELNIVSEPMASIISFRLPGQIGNTYIKDIDKEKSVIDLTMPYGSDLTNLLPVMTYIGKDISQDPLKAQNFTSPVEYIITSTDGSYKRSYTVIVNQTVDPNIADVDFDMNNLSLSGDLANVIANITLPTTGARGSGISWTSNNSAIVISADHSMGTVTRPSSTVSNQVVTLTATISKGSIAKAKVFSLTVLANEAVITPPTPPTPPATNGGGGGGISSNIVSQNIEAINFPLTLVSSQNGVLTQALANGLQAKLVVSPNSFIGTTTFKIVDGLENNALNGRYLELTAVDSNGNIVSNFTNNLALTFSGLNLPADISRLAVYYYDQALLSWSLVPGSVFDQTSNSVSFSVNHIGRFAIFAEQPVTQQVLGQRTYQDGTLLRGSDKHIFVVVGGKLQRIVSLKELAQYSGQEILQVADSVIASYAKVAPKAVLGAKKYAFNRDLKVGSTGSDVQELQKFLNSHGYIVSKTGAGSIGHETTMFGRATQAALIKFQQANKITPAVGYFGALTRKVINK